MTTEVQLAGPDVENAPLPSSDMAICCRSLRKMFGEKVAVRGLTLDVSRGEVFGFLGPNGAGKSTSIKMLLGLVKPTRGSALLLGEPIGHCEARRRVGFLPEHFRFYDWLTAAELLRAFGQLSAEPRKTDSTRPVCSWGLDADQLDSAIPEVIDLVGLTPHASKQLRHYSKGMLQRVGLAQALIHKPELIFLDEPTSGLDPTGRRLVRDLIRLQKERGATVFLNSHLLSDVEATCDRVAFIRDGVVVETAAVSDYALRRTEVTARVCNLKPTILPGMSAWASDIELSGANLRLKLLSPDFAPRVLEYLVLHGADVYDFTSRRDSLDDRFLQIVSGDAGL